MNMPCSALQKRAVWASRMGRLAGRNGPFRGAPGPVSWSTVRRRQSKAAAAVAVWGQPGMARLPALAKQT